MLELNSLINILIYVLIGMVVLVFILGIIYIMLKLKRTNNVSNTNTGERSQGKDENEIKNTQSLNKQSIKNFMEFEKIEDNMIIQKNESRFLMVIECQGINYDLMSQEEQLSVEEGFIQFLNTLRHPIQIYVQTRTVDLESSIEKYKDKVKNIQNNLEKAEIKFNEMKNSGLYTKDQIEKNYYELVKQRNLYEYGKDIIYNTQRMSLSNSVLNKQYYIIIPYYSEEVGNKEYDREEIKELAFQELYTRAQSIIRTLAVCSINSKILNSKQLIELLYMAYNRDESETYSIEKAIRAGYDEIYKTAPDVLQKQMQLIERQVEQEALRKANEKVEEAQRTLQQQMQQIDKELLINAFTKEIIKQNTTHQEKVVVNKALELVEQEEKEKKKTRAKSKVKLEK